MIEPVQPTQRSPQRLGIIGAGWIARYHLDALDRLGRTRLVGVVSASLANAEAVARPRGADAYTDVADMLDEQRPDVAYVCVPPARSLPICRLLVERGIPFLVEKPLATTDDAGPAELAEEIDQKGLVVAVGYHLRALEALPLVRERLSDRPPHLVVGRWLDSTPPRPWWWTEASGGGQVVEQATHLYDLARALIGEATVVGAASTRIVPSRPQGASVADATAALLRFASGAVGTFANDRRLPSGHIEIAFASDGMLTTIAKAGGEPGAWTVRFSTPEGDEVIPPGRDPYEMQAERFLGAVEDRDPAGVCCTYVDALATHRLTRAVVAATGQAG